MKTKQIVPIVFGLLLLSQLATAQIWSEEFNSGSAPDGTVWSYDLGASGWGNNELQNYTSDAANVRVEGGNLIITAVKQGNTFTSARIKTQHKLTFQYGTVEARIKVPDLSDGLWPAFWTLGNNFTGSNWPACGEIDVMEMGSASAISANRVNRRVNSTAHWSTGNNDYASYGLTRDAPSGLDGSFHIYRMEWTPSAITTYIDNDLIWSMTISNPESFGGTEFHQPHFFLLNLAVGGNFPGILQSSGITAPSPAEYVVDYIRIFDNGFTVLDGSSLAPPPDTDLVNPGFESGTTGWTVIGNGGTVAASTARARSGSSSLRIDSAGAAQWSSPHAFQSFAAAPGDVFNLQAYMLSPSGVAGGSFGLLKIVFRDSNGDDLLPASADVGNINTSFPGIESEPFLDSASQANSWVRTEAQGEAPAGTAEVRFYLLNVNESSNVMYFDDVLATQVGGPILPVTVTPALVGGELQLSFPTQIGVSYDVVYRDNLSDATWTPVETVPGDGTTKSVSYPANTPGRYYRVEAN